MADGDGGGVLVVELPADVDPMALAALLPGLAPDALTADAAVALFRALLAQALELDERARDADAARAELERREVELDQAYQDKESATKDADHALDQAQRDLRALKEERDRLATSQSTLQAQLASVSDTHTASSAELHALRHRVADVEQEKRDLVAIVSRHKEDAAQQEEEIITLRANLKQARQDHLALESQLREARSNETSTRFKIDSLTQQLELARGEAERASADLTIKAEEFATYRRTRGAEASALQTKLDALTQQHHALQSTHQALQAAHAAQTTQLTQALARVQAGAGQLADQDARYAAEAAGLKRLVRMLEEREGAAKAVMERIERDWADVGSRTEAREAALLEEAADERARADRAEKRVRHLEDVLRRVDSGEFQAPAPGALPSLPATPAFGTPARADAFGGGMFGLSPTVALASRTQKSGKTFTEVYSDYVKLQEELARKNLEYENMEQTLKHVLGDIEERAPLLNAQREEFERAKVEAAENAERLQRVMAEVQDRTKAAEEASQKLAASTRENELLNKQLRDLGRQITTLLRDIARRDDPTLPADAELDADAAAQPAANTEELITNHLVLFRSVEELQAQNQRLLKIVRELGDKLEREERGIRAQCEQEQFEAVREAHEMIQELEARIEAQRAAHDAAAAAYAQERDTLRGMLARAGQAAPPAQAAPQIAGDAAANRKLAEMQDHFDAYHAEMGADARRVRDELVGAQREVHHLESALKKAEAQADVATEHHRIMQEQLGRTKRELQELDARHQALALQCARAESEHGALADGLHDARAEADRLRNEAANLRAEKKIWAGIEGRLADENRQLALERSKLADLMSNVQKMHSDLERSGENDRRRLEAQLELVQGQAQDLRNQLSHEREAVRSLTVQKEVDVRALQTRLDKTNEDYAKTRELLVGAETSRKHLEQRLDDLGKQLQGNQEKLAVYEHRPSLGASAAAASSGDAAREQQLEAELAEVRASAKMLEIDLARARENVQQFQAIAETSEGALAALSSTHEEYRASAEMDLAARAAELADATSRVHALQQQLAEAQQKAGEVQRAADADRQAWLADKRELEGTIVDMTTSEKSVEHDRVLRDSTVRELEERTKFIEERYSREIIAHAEAMKTVSTLREQLKKAQEDARNGSAAAEGAQAKLAASEGSWLAQKQALEKDAAALDERCKGLARQNALLHEHLETVTTQAARIRQAADGPGALPAAAGEGAEQLGELRDIVVFLRKEKEMNDVRLEVVNQENVRLRAQVDHLSQSLAETREMLSQERERAVQAATSEAQHAELVERINQLALLRESNATLRADCEASAKRARELDARLKEVSAELDPVKDQLRQARGEIEARDARVQRLEAESTSWQERNRQLLSKYDRIDPAEMQALKEEVEKAQADKTAVELAVAERDEQIRACTQRIEALEATNARITETGKRNNGIFKKKMEAAEQERTQSAETIAALQAQVAQLQQERDALAAQMEAAPTADGQAVLAGQIDTLIRENANLERALAEAKAVSATGAAQEEADAEITRLRGEVERLTAEKEALLSAAAEAAVAAAPASGESASADVQALQAQWAAEKQELVTARDNAQAQSKNVQQQAQQAIIRARNERAEQDKLKAKIEQLEKERADLQQQIAALEAASSAPKAESDAPAGPAVDELVKQHQEELQAQALRLKAEANEALNAAVEAAKVGAAPSGTAYTEEDIAAAVERGRKELGAKLKIKDSQLSNMQAKLKTLEQQMLQLSNIDKAGTVTATAPAAAGAAATAAKPITRKASMAAAGAPVAPAAAAAAAAAGPSAGPAGAGRGRGQGQPARGAKAPRQLGGRGGGASGGPAGAAAADSNGLSISGAAAKRAREETGTASDDSLAKRLRPAPADAAGKAPVAIRRTPANP